ncbi:hypothetical protein ILUMI_08820 [Ignelater luminosus]|uniref:Uncharacterized protein n=1 Tax=Ignelater luminosus TaxID=2038154 RepID=A0A8K0DAJ5_IGNLU|nr:hypothetical protein ILUMI_08820 [Ignelater luminosus]
MLALTSPVRPSSSPGSAPSGYYFLPELKKYLAGSRFSDDGEMKEAVQRFLKDMAASWYDMGIQKRPQRLQKCFDRNADYVEK